MARRVGSSLVNKSRACMRDELEGGLEGEFEAYSKTMLTGKNCIKSIYQVNAEVIILLKIEETC